MPLIGSHSFREQAQRFGVACEWLRAKGLRVEPTRLGEYQRQLTEIVEYYESGRIEQLEKLRGRDRLYNALTQADELIDIHEGLSSLAEPGLIERLKTFSGGVSMLADESTDRKGTYPRNIGFELSIAAAAASVGLPIDFRSLADLRLATTPRPFFVECKRPFSSGAIPVRIKEGFEQLQNRYAGADDPPNARGVLALSLSKALNDGSLLLSVPSAEAIDHAFAKEVDAVMGPLQHLWDENVALGHSATLPQTEFFAGGLIR